MTSIVYKHGKPAVISIPFLWINLNFGIAKRRRRDMFIGWATIHNTKRRRRDMSRFQY
jgi:hypothetical protein